MFAGTAHATPARIEMVERGAVGAADMARLTREAHAAAARVDTWLGIDAGAMTLHIEVYPTLEAKGLATSYTLPTHAFPEQSLVVCAAEAGFDGELAREVAATIIMRVMGRATNDVIEEGLAVACAPNWRGNGCRYWARMLSAYDDTGDLTCWLDNRSYRAESPLVRRAVAGELACFLVETRGAAGVRRIFAHGLTPDERAALVPAWRTHMRELSHQRPVVVRSQPPAGFLRGFCHAHEGYAIMDGYLSARSDRALGEAHALGANAVSITPFTFMESPDRPARFPFSSGARAENDESIIHASLAAKRAGMNVMIKPHVWVGRSWPGEISFNAPAQWSEFFAYYERWIRHYALLAEMEHIDLLCVGVELAKTTVGHEAQWTALVERLRTVYHGRLTYAANWGGEFEQVSFWRAFDYIGIDCYYPLCTHDVADDATLAKGARAVMDRIDGVARRYGRCVLVTEVGFPSTATAPWRSPHDDSGEPGVGLAGQARCFDAWLGAVQGRERIAGVYCWKWPSDPETRDRRDGFMLNGTPAESVISSWYSRAR